MKSKIFLTALILISPFFKVLGQYNYNQKLGDLGSITLPDTPKIVTKEGNQLYLIKFRGIGFLAGIGDVSGGLKNLFDKENLDSLYNVYIKSIVKTSGGTMFYKNNIWINGNKGVEFGFSSYIKGKKTFGHYRAVSIQDTMLTCGIISADSVSKSNINIKKYLDGFKVKDADYIRSDNATNAGRVTGQVLFFLIGVGLVFLIYRSKKRTHPPRNY